MNSNPTPPKSTKTPKSVNKVIQNHFENIDKGVFDPASFCTDLQTIPAADVDYKKCIHTLMKLTKDNITGNGNSQIITQVEKMTNILLDKFTVKKSEICEVLFFPSVDNEAKIVEYLKAAKKSIYVCMFTITNEHLCTALLDAYLRGVDVKILTDDEELRIMGSNVRDLSEEGIVVRTDASSRSLMHNKFTIIDQKILMTGSYNWTVRATKANQENVVIVDSQDLVVTFANEFNKLWAQFNSQTIANMGGKQKTKTRLYQKYQDALAKLEKQKLKHDLKKSLEDDEATGVIQKSKKITKAPKAAAAPKNSKHVKKAIPQDVETEASTSVQTTTIFFQSALKLLYLFVLVLLTRYFVANLSRSTAMDLERSFL